MFYLFSVISFFFAFLFLRTCFGILAKNLNHAYNLRESAIFGIYFGVQSTFMQHSNFHPTDGAIIMFVGIIVMPLLYILSKWLYLRRKGRNIIMGVWFFPGELAILLLGTFLGLAVSQYLGAIVS